MKTEEKTHELFLNYACNAKCAFCYNPPITPELLRLELSFDDAAKSLYGAAKDGATSLNIHGGEPTLRDDLPKLLALARKLGFTHITVVTNGIRLAQPGYAKLLHKSGATHLRVSVHGSSAGLHDAVVEIPGAFEKVLKGLETLKALGVPHGLNFVIHRRNLADLPDFLDLFIVKLAVPEVIVYFPHLRGMAAINAQTLSVRYEEAAPLLREGAKRLAAAGRSDALMLANFPPCALPELRSRMHDWEKEPEAATDMVHPEGFREDLFATKSGQRRAVKACESCELSARCLGVEREYLALHGEKEFLPVTAAAAAGGAA